jgi:hypothetical protein
MLNSPQLDIGVWLEDLVPEEDTVEPASIDVGHGVEKTDHQAWKNKRMEWAHPMWEDIGHATI